MAVPGRLLALAIFVVVACEEAKPGGAPDTPPIATAEPTLPISTGPDPSPPRKSGLPVRLVAERAIVLAGAANAIRTREIPRQDSEHLVAALKQGYDRMARSELRISFDGLEPTGQTTTTIVEPADADALDVGVVFLHGYGGPFAVQCWHVAEALKRARPRTLCPSIGTKGAWWTREGRRIIEDSAAKLRDRGATRVILVGLSNGARGAAKWASRIDPPPDAVVVISGAAARPPPENTPVLALTGRRDTMFSPGAGRRYARAAAADGRYVTLPGGHFAFLEHWPEAAEHMDQWLDDIGLIAHASG